MKTTLGKSEAVRISGVPSTHIDYLWRKKLLTYKNEVGRAHRLDYNPGLIFEIRLANTLNKAGVEDTDIKAVLRSLKKCLSGGKGKNKIAFNPYSGTKQRDTDVDLVLAGDKKYLVEAKAGKKRQFWELMRDYLAARGKGREETEFTENNPVAVFIRLSLLAPLIEEFLKEQPSSNK